MGCGCGSKFSGRGGGVGARRPVQAPIQVTTSPPSGRVVQSAEMRKPGSVTTSVPLKRTTV